MAQSNERDPTREQNGDSAAPQNPQQVAAEMAKAFQELAKGEQTASALERQLDGIESRIDELLAAAEASAKADSDGDEAKDNSQGFNGRLDNDTTSARSEEQ